jgi:hypothetical protein
VGLSAPTPVAFFLPQGERKVSMYLCYIDESGTSDIPGNTSHYVLAGLSVPVWHWRNCDKEIGKVKASYSLENAEIHTAWMVRRYLEQTKVADFDKLDYVRRRYEVSKLRKAELLRLQRSKNPKQYKQTRKNYKKTEDYIHLSHSERWSFIEEIAQTVSGWGYARLFAECVDKIHFDPTRAARPVDEQAFEQVVSRFEQYLGHISSGAESKCFGLLIHDNNVTVAKKHTELMKRFHRKGTLWTEVSNIIETPLYVDSQLTSMVQIADLCSYALRRYLENGEEKLFDLVFERADRKDDTVVGVRHFTDTSCRCKICYAHRPYP